MDNIIDKDHFDRVRKTIVLGKVGDIYRLNCKLYKRGNKDVTYHRGDNCLMQGRIRYALSENAVKDVESAIEPYDEKVNSILSGAAGYRIVKYGDTGITLYYKHKENDQFDSLTMCENNDEKYIYYGKTECILQEDVGIKWILALPFGAEREYNDAGYNITMNNLHNHPLYKSAVDNEDETMRNILEVLYGNPDETVLDYMEGLDGVRRLPRLAKLFDRRYTLLKEEIDWELLMRSGYTFLHRPYFAMQGYSHERCMLNPHDKSGVDAGKAEAELISFAEYLALFDDHGNWCTD